MSTNRTYESLSKAFAVYKKQGFFLLPNDKKYYEAAYKAGFTMKQKGDDVVYVIEWEK